MKSKLTSRKFWICVAAFMASIGSSIAGMNMGNKMIACVGIICTVISTAIYAAAESVVDAARLQQQVVILPEEDPEEGEE